MIMNAYSRVHVGKVAVDRVSRDEMLARVSKALRTRHKLTIFYANAYAVTLAESDASFADTMGRADMIFCDGYGTYIASRILKGSLPERFAWPDWIEQLGKKCHGEGAMMFYLGARPGVAKAAAGKLERMLPGLVVHSHHGHFPKDGRPSDEVVELINRSGAEVLLVGFGMPLQEYWITTNRDRLRPLVVFSVGAMFDYEAGHMRRGPRWLTQYGFEWLTRLLSEPGRLWRRYLLGLPAFGVVVGKQWLAERAGSGRWRA